MALAGSDRWSLSGIVQGVAIVLLAGSMAWGANRALEDIKLADKVMSLDHEYDRLRSEVDRINDLQIKNTERIDQLYRMK